MVPISNIRSIYLLFCRRLHLIKSNCKETDTERKVLRMSNSKIKKIPLLSSLAGLLLLGGCSSSETDFEREIVPTTGEFTQQDEAFYQRRYEVLVQAFATGQETTTYDTEVDFGQDLRVEPLPRGQSSAFTPEIYSSIEKHLENTRTASLMVFENGKVVGETFFGDNNKDTLINSKSLAKPLGVVAVGRAIKAGYIENLDQSVSDFIIEWQGTDKAAITVRHLLDMRTGLLPQGAPAGPDDVLNRAYLHPRHDEVIIHEYPLSHPPGTRYDYSNANSELISIVIMRATGLPYEEWLVEQVLKPMGMAGGKIWLNREGGVAHSGCCIGLPSETYLKLAVLVLENGLWDGKPFLPNGFVKEMTTATPQNKHSGMGLYIGRDYAEFRGAANPDVEFGRTYHSQPYIDKDLILFDGNGHQVAYILPSRRLVIMRLGKAPGKDKVWDNAYIPNLVVRALDD